MDVTDEGNVLNGYWHSDGPSDGSDNNSQDDTYAVSVSGGETNTTGDFGYYREPASLGNFVWDDTNRDNLQGGELGIADVTVQLTINWPNGSSTTVSTVTDANGYYRFDNLLLDEDFDGAGGGEPTFSVTFTPPSTYTPVTPNVGSDDTVDSDGTTNVPATVTQGAYNDTIDSGFKQVVSIGDTLWYDWDGDGTQDVDEPGIPNVDVFIDIDNNGVYDAGTDLLDTTDADGQYLFTDLAPGTYRVIVDTSDPDFPSGVTQTGDPDSTLDSEHTVVASTPGNYLDVDFGYQGTGSISDYVWNDMNRDGVQDASESGIEGVTVWVDLNGDGTRDADEPSDVTDADGLYYIGGLYENTVGYTVRVDTTGGSPVNGATATYDVDGGSVPAGSPNVATVTLNAGQNRTDVDWGYQYARLDISKTSSTGGTVNPGDTINYTIIVRNNTTARQTGIVISDLLPAGTTYVAQSTVASGYRINSSALGTIADDFETNTQYGGNDGSYANFSSNWIEYNDDNSATSGSIQGDDSYACIAGGHCLTIRAWTSSYAGDYIERRASLNAATSATLTYNWDTGTYNGSGGQVQAQVSDDGTNFTTIATYTANGSSGSESVVLENVAGISLPATNFFVRFLISNASGGYAVIDDVVISVSSTSVVATTLDNNIGDPTYGDLSNGVPANLVTAADNFALNAGQSMQVTFSVTVNNPATLYSIDNTACVTSDQQGTAQCDNVSDALPRPGAIGDYVWVDEDGDGEQDAGEAGIPNATVTLSGTDADGNSVSRTTTTDANGRYLFSNLPASDASGYTITVDNTTLPANLAANPTYDENGTGTPHATVVVLASGVEHMTADFGYNWAPPSDTDTPSAGATGAIGDRIWIDADGDGVQDAGEAGTRQRAGRPAHRRCRWSSSAPPMTSSPRSPPPPMPPATTSSTAWPPVLTSCR